MSDPKASSAPPRIVCFDLGGVLVRICRSWEEGCRAAGIDIRVDSDLASGDPSRLTLVHDLEVGAISPEQFFRTIAEGMQNLYSPEEIERVHHAWILGEYPGVADLIGELRTGPATLACLSNTNAPHWEQMRGFASLDALHHRFASHELACRKPDEQIFRAFEDRLEARPREILFFDDTHANIAGALEAGWRAERIDHSADTAAQMKDHLRAYGVIATD
jgi:putative hydrolase of the HAD superfamily